MSAAADFAEAALRVLAEGEPNAKAEAARRAAEVARRGGFNDRLDSWPTCPERPARPERPRLVAPGAVPRRGLGTLAGRTALLHALAHIEFNAIDLAFDMALRFAPQIAREGLDWRAFAADWASVGGDEARHFAMVSARLGELGSFYGALPAHDSLWQSAATTADDALARLAIAPLVLEARGLDVTPAMIINLDRVGDAASKSILSTIYEEEVGHVAIGVRWFERLCAARRVGSESTFRALVAERYAGSLKGPFNHAARGCAGLKEAYYAGQPAAGTKVAVEP